MPAVLTHKTIMLLARERLARMRDTLRHKLDTSATVTDLEYRLWYLADRAHTLMSENAGATPAIQYPTDANLYPTPLGQGVSRFSVMGSMGPDIPAFAALFAKGQGWVFDTVHKGNPDSHRELVVAKTTTFALELWAQVRRAVSEGRATEDQARMLAGYVLGHLCHVAADVISHPYINDLEWHQGYATRGKFSHEGGEGSIDARVARQVLLRGGTREGQDWDVWWPTVDEVPGAFYPAYVDALERVYRAQTSRPVGFGKFEAEFLEHQPPALSVDFLRDGYGFYRNAVLSMGYGWGAWRWFFFLTPVMLPLMGMVPLMVALPHAKQFLERTLDDVDERGWSELLTFPMTLALVPTAFYGIWLSALTTKGVEGLHAAGLGTTGLSAILALTFFVTLGMNPPWWVRWLILFAPWALATAVFTVKGLVDMGTGNKPRGALGLIYGMPFIFMVIAFVLFVLVLGPLRLIGPDFGVGVFVVLALLVAGLLIWRWIVAAPALRDARIPEQPEPFPADRPHFVRLFDDSTLWSLPGTGPAPLDQLHYPSGSRPLLKLWWEGTGDLYVRSEQSRLDFSFTGIGEPVRTVQAPVAPMSAREYAEFLNQVFEGPGGERNKLKAALVYATDGERDYPLPPGATFQEDRPRQRISVPLPTDVWHKLGTSAASTTYVLRHSDKPYQSVRFGLKGPVDAPAPEDDGATGPGEVTTNGTVVTGFVTGFDFFFDEGDQIEVEGQVRTVTRVVSETELRVDNAFNPAITSRKPYARVGPRLERGDGYMYVTDARVPPGVVGGGTIMDLAADLGALLCLGMTPHLLSDADRRVPELQGKQAAGTGAAVDPGVSKVYQVFRNWSLDRRRMNEWRMLVAGGARSEKGGNPAAYDPALPQPKDPDWVQPRAPAGEPVLNAQGWVPVLRQWLERAGRNTSMVDPGVSAPGNPSAQNLSQALAYLLDLPEPVLLK